MTASLQKLEQKKLNAGLGRLAKAGINIPRWLAMLDADDKALKRLESAWPVFITSYAYDAVHMLGFGAAAEEALPQAKFGEFIIRYGGWSLQELRDSKVGRKLMHQRDWYNSYQWSREKLPSRIYRLRIPVPYSNALVPMLQQERESLASDERLAPIVLVVTALLAHKLHKNEDPLHGDRTRCNARIGTDRVEIFWRKGRIDFSRDSADLMSDGVWISSIRTS